MSNKENFNEVIIHLYAIAEGTGHIQRIYNIFDYLSQFYKNIEIFIWNQKNRFIKNVDNSRNKIFRTWEELELNIKSHHRYIIIADIRDNNPEILVKLYKKTNNKILCLDNHYTIKQKEIDYWTTLPYVDSKDSFTEILKNHFWAREFIDIFLSKTKETNHPSVLIYLGLTDHPYNTILKDKKNLQSILHHLNLKYFEIHYIDKENYSSRKEFYQALKIHNVVITYPGLLFYESMFLNKKIIAYDLDSQVHQIILEKIIHQYYDYYKADIKINSFRFFYFDFENFREKELNHFNLWTSYRKLKNWIEENQ